jgi:hypothetical protein
MADLEALFQAVKELSTEERAELSRYIANMQTQESEPSADIDKPRILGLHEHLGKAWMSDDFDAELPDEFWFGEE